MDAGVVLHNEGGFPAVLITGRAGGQLGVHGEPIIARTGACAALHKGIGRVETVKPGIRISANGVGRTRIKEGLGARGEKVFRVLSRRERLLPEQVARMTEAVGGVDWNVVVNPQRERKAV